jgi:arylsulfatase A-like enzyme
VTPNLDALVRQGTIFTQAISVAGNTPVCLGSLFTGTYPFVHRIRPTSLNRLHLSTTKLNPNCSTLAETLRREGWETVATMTGPLLHVTGLDRGFSRYLYRQGDNVYLHDRFGDELKALLRDLKNKSDPWFLFVHLWELHAPRQVQPSFNSSRYGRNRYERAVSSIDQQLGEVLKEVDLDSTLVILHGDHGEGMESLFEFLLHPRLHDRIGVAAMRLFYSLFFKWIHQYRCMQSAHGLNLYDYLMRVPLILAGSGIPAGRVIKQQVSQVDIMPTIVDYAGLAGSLNGTQGASLCPLIAGNAWNERPVYMEAYSGKSVSPRYLPMRRVKPGVFQPPALVGLRTPEWKCIWVPDDAKVPTELYHLTEDPSELNNLAGERPETVAELKAQLPAIQSAETSRATQAEMSPDEQAILERRLRDLGYL